MKLILFRNTTWMCGKNTALRITAWLSMGSQPLPPKAPDPVFPSLPALELLSNLLKSDPLAIP